MEAVKHLRHPDLQAPWQQHTLVLPPAARLLALPNAQSCAQLLLHPDPATAKHAVSKVPMTKTSVPVFSQFDEFCRSTGHVCIGQRA